MDSVREELNAHPERLNEKNQHQDTPLMAATKRQNLPVLKYLISLGASIDAMNWVLCFYDIVANWGSSVITGIVVVNVCAEFHPIDGCCRQWLH